MERRTATCPKTYRDIYFAPFFFQSAKQLASRNEMFSWKYQLTHSNLFNIPCCSVIYCKSGDIFRSRSRAAHPSMLSVFPLACVSKYAPCGCWQLEHLLNNSLWARSPHGTWRLQADEASLRLSYHYCMYNSKVLCVSFVLSRSLPKDVCITGYPLLCVIIRWFIPVTINLQTRPRWTTLCHLFHVVGIRHWIQASGSNQPLHVIRVSLPDTITSGAGRGSIASSSDSSCSSDVNNAKTEQEREVREQKEM